MDKDKYHHDGNNITFNLCSTSVPSYFNIARYQDISLQSKLTHIWTYNLELYSCVLKHLDNNTTFNFAMLSYVLTDVSCIMINMQVCSCKNFGVRKHKHMHMHAYTSLHIAMCNIKKHCATI